MRRKILGVLIKNARKRAGLSQMKLAERMGITYQQVQKYEAGKSNVSVVRLYDIASALDIPLNKLLPDERQELLKVSESVEVYGLLDEDERRVVEYLRKIENKRLRKAILKVLEEMAGEYSTIT